MTTIGSCITDNGQQGPVSAKSVSAEEKEGPLQ
ncbi:hypothetical protein ZBT109_1827 [Zymobacter palmae]|uniref:Uncharacterized protein n=1 Tax=Zymobacter palmae TaxID=33074 RepID=A0A348HG21_9GAMM|nr:hypothetical protein ZBT109_1827 [Zymobacter palmae]